MSIGDGHIGNVPLMHFMGGSHLSGSDFTQFHLGWILVAMPMVILSTNTCLLACVRMLKNRNDTSLLSKYTAGKQESTANGITGLAIFMALLLILGFVCMVFSVRQNYAVSKHMAS